MSSSLPTSFFVYGTLKRGQCREHLWPETPQSITTAWTLATLYGRQDYPAIQTGEDRVLGEVWRFEASQMPQVIKQLDRIEGTNQPNESDLYSRCTVNCFDLNEHPLGISYCYFYVIDPREDGFHRILPSDVLEHPDSRKLIENRDDRRDVVESQTDSRLLMALWPER